MSLLDPNTKYKEISNKELDTLTDEEVKRILVCSNDGQGDTYCYTFADIFNLISESDIKYNNQMVRGADVIQKMSRSEILYEFCKDMSANMTEYIYFDIDDNEYKIIKWRK